jgi:dTMP kinase
MIIAIEGPDYSGKTECAKQLTCGFASSIIMRDPGCTLFGEKMREILLDPAISLTPIQQTLVFIATHDALMDAAVDWELEHPDGLVILDRCFISTLAYQSAGGVPFHDLLHIGRVSGAWRLDPSQIFYISVPEAERIRRRDAAGNRGKDRFESKPPEYWKKVAEGYRMARDEWGYTEIDGMGTPHEVACRIYERLDGSKILKVW